MADLSGRSIAGFSIERELQKGAQGRVYAAVCETDEFPNCPRGTKVVLKTMPSADETGEGFRKLSERTRLLAGIDHPNVVKYLGCFKVQEAFGDLHAVVVERLNGETLKAKLHREQGGLDADFCVSVIEGMVRGLGVAAAAGVCHRDVKPANIFICDDGTVKVIDFEASRVAAAGAGGTTSSEHLAGSFDYMAPEFTDPSFAGDEQSDIFSAGVVAHEMLTGALPYRKAAGEGDSGPQSADFAFLERWARNSDGTFVNKAVVMSARIRRLLAHADRLFSGSLTPERPGRFKNFAEMLEAVKAVRFRELKSGAKAYRILKLVGKGGFGEVFKARLRTTGQAVAIKHLLNPDYADRFYREAKIMSQLDDPCFVKFLDFMVVDKAGNKDAFLVMDFLPGMPGNSLKDAIREAEGGLPRKNVLAAFARYAHGLKVLHSRGIFHRDIKPANLYYPEGRPQDSAIMDLGIARDIHGTVTTGNVPGTFDYMAPEIVSEGCRGESGADIYALGLCMYEALTGKTAYPRLPKGYAAYAQFFRRAQRMERPSFDAPEVKDDPKMLSILTAMTEPDVSKRLVDTAEVERRIVALIFGGASEVSAVEYSEDAATITETLGTPTQTPTSPAPPPVARRVPAPPPPEKKAKPRRAIDPAVTAKAVRAVAVGLLVAALGTASYFYGPAVVDGCKGAVMSVQAKWRERQAAKAAVEEQAQMELRIAEAEGEAKNVAGQYSLSNAKSNEVETLRARWDAKWRDKIPEADFARMNGTVSAARDVWIARERKNREFLAKKNEMQTEAGKVVEAYAEDEIERADALKAAWEAKWRKSSSLLDIGAKVSEIAQARKDATERIRIKDLIQKAATEAKSVCREYSESGLEVGNLLATRWKASWGDKLPTEVRVRIESTITKCRDEAAKRKYYDDMKERRERTLAECTDLCETLEPVEQRASRLQYAERQIREAFREGTIDSATHEKFLAMIKRLSEMIVVRIVNKSGREISVVGKVVPNGRVEVFSFTNGIPKGAAVECRGYKPLEIRDWMNGRTFDVTPEHLEVDRVDVLVASPGPDVVCRIDGAPVKYGIVRVLPGTHECSYSRNGYETQTFPFMVELATPTQIPAPSHWTKLNE